MSIGEGVTILTPGTLTAEKVYICFVAKQRPDGTPYWARDLIFTGPKGYEMCTGWDAAAQRAGMRRHIITAELPPP